MLDTIGTEFMGVGGAEDLAVRGSARLGGADGALRVHTRR